MLTIRTVNRDDLAKIKAIHHKFYANEFEFPEDHYLGAFIIEKDNEVITAGGVRTLAEITAVTNKDINPRLRIAALKMLLQASSFVCGNSGYSHLHAFVQDENWNMQLQRNGFFPTKGNALITEI